MHVPAKEEEKLFFALTLRYRSPGGHRVDGAHKTKNREDGREWPAALPGQKKSPASRRRCQYISKVLICRCRRWHYTRSCSRPQGARPPVPVPPPVPPGIGAVFKPARERHPRANCVHSLSVLWRLVRKRADCGVGATDSMAALR